MKKHKFMKKYKFRMFGQLGALFALLAGLFACSSSGDALFPQIASPPPFDYADGAVLRSRMHRLAFASQRLDLTLMTSDERGNSTQREVISTLRDIERIAGELEDGDLSTTHGFLRNDMQNFQANLNRALREVERNPPSYYAAGQVTGSCVNCHRTVQ